MLAALAGAALVAHASRPAQAEVLDKTRKVGGVTVQYKVVLPNGYDAANLEGGMGAWVDAGRPIVSTDGATPFVR